MKNHLPKAPLSGELSAKLTERSTVFHTERASPAACPPSIQTAARSFGSPVCLQFSSCTPEICAMILADRSATRIPLAPRCIFAVSAIFAMHHRRNVGGWPVFDIAADPVKHGVLRRTSIRAALFLHSAQCLRAADVFVRHFLSSSSSSDTPGKTIHVSQRSTHRFSQSSRQ